MSQREPPIPPPFDAPGWVQDQYNREVDEWHAWKDSQKSSTGNGEYKKGAAKAPSIMDAKALRAKVFPPIKFIVRGYVVEGATLLAGRPGKSWLALVGSCGRERRICL
jgi:hypothetical protein